MRTTSHPPRLRVALVIFGATATFLAAPAGVLTQGQPTPAAPSRTQNVFRATTNFVSVDVIVTSPQLVRSILFRPSTAARSVSPSSTVSRTVSVSITRSRS